MKEGGSSWGALEELVPCPLPTFRSPQLVDPYQRPTDKKQPGNQSSLPGSIPVTGSRAEEGQGSHTQANETQHIDILNVATKI